MDGPHANNTSSEGGVKFHEGWLEHKGHEGKWTRYWCVLRNNVFSFHSGDGKQIGCLTLDEKSKMECKSGDMKSGFKFDLYTSKRLSNFKTQKSCERELWKAYVEGITKGRIADTIDLLPGQIREIQDQLGRYLTAKRSLASAASRRNSGSNGSANSFDSPQGSSSGSFSPETSTSGSYYLTPVSPGQVPNSGGTPSQPQELSNLAHPSMPGSCGGSALVFYSGAARTGRPSWYFSDCTRQQAEDILKNGAQYGNTLMRSKPDSELELVISKMNNIKGAISFSHFIVKCHPNGYKIDVENPHNPMVSLSEVMTFFIETSGRSSTKPMTCNDLYALGLEDNPYNTSIIAVKKDTESEEPKMRYPHTTREVSSWRNKHPSVAHIHFPPSARGPLDDPNFFPPPPPPISESDKLGLPPESPPPIPQHHSVPAPPPLVPPQPCAGANIQAPHVGGKGGKALHDRSKSVPVIPNDIITQVRRHHQLQNANGGTPRKMMNKSSSLDTERPPPLPPNHPASDPVRKLSVPAIPEHNAVQPQSMSQLAQPNSTNFTPTGNNTSNLTSARQRDPTKPNPCAIPSPVSPTLSASKRTSFPRQESNSAMDELAAVTARVLKQQTATEDAPKSTAPEVAPKPTGFKVAGGTIADSRDGPKSVQLKPPMQKLVTDSFRQRLGNLVTGSTASLTALMGDGASPGSQGSTSTDQYENIEQYQNSREILASSRNF